MARLSWAQRLEGYADLPKVTAIPERMQRKNGQGTIVIPSPTEVQTVIRRIRPAHVASVEQIAQRIARDHGTTIGCTVTTGIFAWMVANAADESERAGADDVVPYWRVLKAGGELNLKYPGGLDNILSRLESEGHVVLHKRGRYVVAEHEGVGETL